MKILTILIPVLFINFFQTLAFNPGNIKKSSSLGNDPFMVGLKIGLNFTQPMVLQKFNVLNPLDDAINQSGVKSYKPFFQNIGYQYAFTALYSITKSLDIRLEPTFTTYNYKYNASYFWISAGAIPERIDLTINHRQTLKYIEIPVTLRYLIGSSKAKPFVQGGIFYGFLINAIKTSDQTETLTNELGTSTINSEKATGDAMPLFVKSRYGFNAGIGVDYDLTAVHITFDINLNFGINKVTNEAGRYSTQQYSGGLYDVQDDARIIIPSINIGVLFPLHKPARSKMKCPV